MAILEGVVTAQRVQAGWSKAVADTLQEFLDKPLGPGGITVTGHDYWYILEYGSSPAEPNPGPKPTDEVILNAPTDIESKHHTSWYPIVPVRAKKLVFTDRHGNKRIEDIVHHPGIHARGFIRRIIFDFENILLEELAFLDAEGEDSLPNPKDIADAINRALSMMLSAIREATPEPTDKDGFVVAKGEDGTSHLRDAWGIKRVTLGRNREF